MSDRVTVYPGKLRGVISAIPSKSHAHRLLICAALAGDETRIQCPSVNEDILATARCLTALGANVVRDENGFAGSGIPNTPEAREVRDDSGFAGSGSSDTPGAREVRDDSGFAGSSVPDTPGAREVRDDSGFAGSGSSDTPGARVAVLDCGESGSTFRFLLPVAGALGAQAEFLLSGRLPQRPMDALYGAIELHGSRISGAGTAAVKLSGRMSGGRFVLPGNVSSQYISALIFALPITREGGEIVITPPFESKGYVEMTLTAVRRFGVKAEWRGDSIYIPGGQRYISPGDAAAEGDWSAASCILCAAAANGGGVTVTGLDPASGQGDRVIAEIIRDFDALRGAIDISDIPDLAPALALLAAAKDGVTRLTGAGRLRLKESDRAGSITRTLTALGAAAKCEGDEIVITGGAPLRGGEIDPEGDHRIAMMAACAAALTDSPVTITHAGVANKSYPGFYADLERLGMRIEYGE